MNNRRNGAKRPRRHNQEQQLIIESTDEKSRDPWHTIPVNSYCRRALSNLKKGNIGASCRTSILSRLHYFKFAGCCMTCNSGTYAQSSGTALLILPHNHCIIYGPFYCHRSLTGSLVPCLVSPMPLTCHTLTWSRAGMKTGNVPPFLSSSFHESCDRTARQIHHLSTQISTQSRLDSHDASLLQHMNDYSLTL